jgi:drug/metabolite transporter (DMT)-like permease
MTSAARPQWKVPLFAAIVTVSNSLGNFCIAKGMRHLPAPVSSPLSMIAAIFTPWVAGGIALLILWLLSRMAFLSFADLSFMLPITSLGYVANALMGYYFLGEHITGQRWGGILLIVAGTVLVGMSMPKHPSAEPLA